MASEMLSFQISIQVHLYSVVCTHSTLKSNEPDIYAIQEVFPQQENNIPFLENSSPLRKLQQLSKMSLQFLLGY